LFSKKPMQDMMSYNVFLCK